MRCCSLGSESLLVVHARVSVRVFFGMHCAAQFGHGPVEFRSDFEQPEVAGVGVVNQPLQGAKEANTVPMAACCLLRCQPVPALAEEPEHVVKASEACDQNVQPLEPKEPRPELSRWRTSWRKACRY